MADFLDIDSRYLGQEIDRAFYAGEECEFAFGRGEALFSRAPVAIYGMTASRIVEDAGKKHFEFGFTVDMTNMAGPLTGNAGAGWTDFGNYLKLEPQWSPDLVNWSMGKFYPAPVPVVTLPNNVYEFWGRAINVQDAAVKNGSLFFANNFGSTPDSRNNGFTSVVIAGVSLALPNFPYDMSVPGKSAQLQADIRAAGFPGTVVNGSTALNWTISIPSVNYTSYAQISAVGFPPYLIPDPVFGINSQISNVVAQAVFADSLGNPIFTRAFARLKISAGTRYDPYR